MSYAVRVVKAYRIKGKKNSLEVKQSTRLISILGKPLEPYSSLLCFQSGYIESLLFLGRLRSEARGCDYLLLFAVLAMPDVRAHFRSATAGTALGAGENIKISPLKPLCVCVLMSDSTDLRTDKLSPAGCYLLGNPMPGDG
jgi:hypothetical protein